MIFHSVRRYCTNCEQPLLKNTQENITKKDNYKTRNCLMCLQDPRRMMGCGDNFPLSLPLLFKLCLHNPCQRFAKIENMQDKIMRIRNTFFQEIIWYSLSHTSLTSIMNGSTMNGAVLAGIILASAWFPPILLLTPSQKSFEYLHSMSSNWCQNWVHSISKFDLTDFTFTSREAKIACRHQV